eukprot:IDg4217t1
MAFLRNRLQSHSSHFAGEPTQPDYTDARCAVCRATAPHSPRGLLLHYRARSTAGPQFPDERIRCLLVLLIERSVEIRVGLLNAGKDLERDELDRGIDCDAIWAEQIAPRFNDRRIHVALDLPDKVSYVDASKPQLADLAADKILFVFNMNKPV